MKKILQRSLFATVLIGLVFSAAPGFATGGSTARAKEVSIPLNNETDKASALSLLKDLEDLKNNLNGKRAREKGQKILKLLQELTYEAKSHQFRNMQESTKRVLVLAQSEAKKLEELDQLLQDMLKQGEQKLGLLFPRYGELATLVGKIHTFVQKINETGTQQTKQPKNVDQKMETPKERLERLLKEIQERKHGGLSEQEWQRYLDKIQEILTLQQQIKKQEDQKKQGESHRASKFAESSTSSKADYSSSTVWTKIEDFENQYQRLKEKLDSTERKVQEGKETLVEEASSLSKAVYSFADAYWHRRYDPSTTEQQWKEIYNISNALLKLEDKADALLVRAKKALQSKPAAPAKPASQSVKEKIEELKKKYEELKQKLESSSSQTQGGKGKTGIDSLVGEVDTLVKQVYAYTDAFLHRRHGPSTTEQQWKEIYEHVDALLKLEEQTDALLAAVTTDPANQAARDQTTTPTDVSADKVSSN